MCLAQSKEAGVGYDVKCGGQHFVNLGPKEALANARELVASGKDPYLYDSFGDPMGFVELERTVESVSFPDDA